MTPTQIPAFDYEQAKDFYFDKLQADRTGKGRMESALYHSALFVFNKGCQRQDALLAQIAELEEAVRLLADAALPVKTYTGGVAHPCTTIEVIEQLQWEHRLLQLDEGTP